MKDKVIYALGFFDGVHLGHQALLTACAHIAKRMGCKAGVVTFTSHPDALVTRKAPLLINTLSDRDRLILGHGMFDLLELPFDQNRMSMPWQDFLNELLQKGAAGFVCGDDFRFGCKGEGTAEKLAAFCRERNLPWTVVPTQQIDGIRISSTHIRSLLEAGDMENANRFLGHPHVLSGQVVSGRQLGRTIGIPTANLLISEGVICPKHGVYACKAVTGGKEYLAVTNVGNRPTVNGHGITVESWLLDFDGNLYGQTLSLHFYHFLRPEQKFDSLEQLQEEIRKNALQVRKIFEKS